MSAPVPAALRPPFVPGVFDDMPAAVYHAIEAMSSGGVKKMLRSPAHYRLMRDTPNEPTAAMQFGTAVHEGVLEPDTFANRILRAPDFDRRTKDGKAGAEAFAAAAGTRIVLAPADHDRARRCVDAVLAHPGARALLSGAQVERSVFWYDAKYRVPCKARFDIFNRGIADLKTTGDASKEAFARTIASFLYHAQAAHYYSGAEHALDASPDFFAFIAVESDLPHGVAVYRLGAPSLLAGRDEVDEALARYRTALESGLWPAYPPTIDQINVPRWALKR